MQYNLLTNYLLKAVDGILVHSLLFAFLFSIVQCIWISSWKKNFFLIQYIRKMHKFRLYGYIITSKIVKLFINCSSKFNILWWVSDMHFHQVVVIVYCSEILMHLISSRASVWYSIYCAIYSTYLINYSKFRQNISYEKYLKASVKSTRNAMLYIRI